MSTNAIIRKPLFLRGFDLKINMGVTLLFRAEFKQLNFFRKQDIKIYNSASVTFYKLCLEMPLLETQFS